MGYPIMATLSLQQLLLAGSNLEATKQQAKMLQYFLHRKAKLRSGKTGCQGKS